MTLSLSLPKIEPLLLDVSETSLHVTPEQFDRLSLNNPDLRLELTKDGQLIVMNPTGGETGWRNADLSGQLGVWNQDTNLGSGFSSSTGFDFISIGGGIMSPDVSWIEHSRLEGVNLNCFVAVVPDFVIELSSIDTPFPYVRSKMLEYRLLGVKLGLLVNLIDKQVEVYRLGQAVEILESPMSVDCSEVMPEFILNLAEIW